MRDRPQADGEIFPSVSYRPFRFSPKRVVSIWVFTVTHTTWLDYLWLVCGTSDSK